MSFPKIKGLRWLSEDFPDLIAIDITLEDRKIKDLGIEGMKIPQQPGELYIDLSQLAGVRPFYLEGSDDPSDVECTLDIDGMDSFIADISIKNILEAWVFYKRFKYSK